MKIWQHKTLYVKLISTFDSEEVRKYMICVGGADIYINLVCFISPQDQIVIETIFQFPKSLYLSQLSILLMILGNNEQNIIEELKKSIYEGSK